MNLKKILIFLLLFSLGTGYSQKKTTEVITNERTFGKNTINNSEIKGIDYIFPDRIHGTYYDSYSGLLTAQLRGLSKNGKWMDNTGKVVQYDLKNKKTLWDKKIVYTTTSLQQFRNTIIYSIANKSICVDATSGEEIWKVKNNIYYVDANKKIGIGYKFKTSTGYTNLLEGIDLSNGNVIWQRELNREYGWNDIVSLTDSTLLVVASGLHKINLNTGKGWDHAMKTGKKDYKGNIAANAIGVAAGLLTGTFLMSTGHNLVRDLVSNTIVDSNFIYFASKENLVKIHIASGDPVWEIPLPEDHGSKSSIFIKENRVYLVNKGIAYMGDRMLKFGKPFIAAFDDQSGKQIFYTGMDDDPILNFQLDDEFILLIFKNGIKKYKLETGEMYLEREIEENKYGELKYFVGSQVFVSTANEALINLLKIDSGKVYVYTNQGKILSVDKELNISHVFDRESIKVSYLQNEDWKFISKGEQTYVFDDADTLIAEIEMSSSTFIHNNILYFTRNNILSSIDLNQLLVKKED